MQLHSIKYNFALNLANTVVGLLFPVVTFTYASRILAPDGIGIVNFYRSVVSYVTLITALGIPLYAVRKIAKVRRKETERNRLSAEILTLHFILGIIGYMIIAILAATVSEMQENIPLYLLISSTVGFSIIGVSWFYQAVEDFKFITIRSLIVRGACLIGLFVFVKDKSDLLIYAGIIVMAEVGCNGFNFIRLRKYFRYRDVEIRFKGVISHLKPSLKLFPLSIITSIYVQLDVVMLGFLSSNSAVGYYSACHGLTNAILGIVTSLGAVLLPRMAEMAEHKDWENFKDIESKAINFIITICIPIAAGLFITSSELIPLFSGEKFLPAIKTLKIMSPIIVFISLSSLIGMQVLYPQGKEKFVIIATLSGATLNFTINMLLIPSLAENGAATATCIAETGVLATMIICGRKFIHYNPFCKTVLQSLCFTIIMSAGVITMQLLLRNSLPLFPLFAIEVATGIIIYTTALWLSHNEFLTQLTDLAKSKICRRTS